MPATYDSLATVTISSPTPTITFSSISNAYTDLVVVLSARSGGTSPFFLRFNGISTNTYSYGWLGADGSNTFTTSGTNTNEIRLDGSSLRLQAPVLSLINVFNYSGNSNKSVLATMSADYNTAGASGSSINYIAGLWRNTSVISSISLINSFDNWDAGMATLYGIKRA